MAQFNALTVGVDIPGLCLSLDALLCVLVDTFLQYFGAKTQ